VSWSAPLRLALDGQALIDNWRWLAAQSGAAACGAAVKANGYGLGAPAVVERLAKAGCRDFFVSTWGEASALGQMPAGCALTVLHGARDEDMVVAGRMAARPALNTLAQVRRWRDTGRHCDVMVDTGMNRLGVAVSDVVAGALDGLHLETLMSHLACADEDVVTNGQQRTALAALAGRTSAKRLSLANSAAICMGPDYAFDLTRPGLALYGGTPRAEARAHIRQVVAPQAQILQRRTLKAGDRIGYNLIFTAPRAMEVAILNLGYADGYLRCFSGMNIGGGGSANAGRCPVIGRVSMDLTAIDVSGQPALAEGDWVSIDYDLSLAARVSGLSQYELLTALGTRYDRIWI
jgi:alanine racemase